VERQIAGPTANGQGNALASAGLEAAQVGAGVGNFSALISREAWQQHAAAFVGAPLGSGPAEPGPSTGPPASGDGIAVVLDAGWNLVGWNGDSAPAAEALLPLGDAYSDAFVYESAEAAFRRFSPGAPAFINTLETLPRSAGVWILASRTVVWQQPVVAALESVDLLPGFNLVAWGGPITPAADAFAAIIGQLITAFTYDTAAVRFRSFASNRPAVLNDLDVVRPGDGVWLNMAAATAWRPGPAAGSV